MRVYHRDGTVLAVHADTSPGGYPDAEETWLPDGFGVRVGGPSPAKEALAAWPVEDMRVRAEAFVDFEAERRRGLVASPAPGQLVTYERKAVQARACILDPARDQNAAAMYGMVAADAVLAGSSLVEAAEIVLANASAWWRYGESIEGARRAANDAIRKAATPEAVMAVLAGVEWPGP